MSALSFFNVIVVVRLQSKYIILLSKVKKLKSFQNVLILV